MQLSSLLSAAALAWSATSTALLLPPDTTGDALDAFKALSGSDNRLKFNVQCLGCPVAQDKEDEGPRGYIQAAELSSELVIDAYVNEYNEVVVGGVPVYPPQQTSPGPISAKQILVEGGDGMVNATQDELSLSTRIDIGQEKKFSDESTTTIVPIALEVLGIEEHVVHVATITFNICIDQISGKYAVANPEILPTVTSAFDAACTTVFCRVKAQMMAKMAAAKAKAGAFASSCMRKMGFKSHPHPHGGNPRPDNVIDRLKGGPNKFGKKPCPGKGRMGKHAHGQHAHGQHQYHSPGLLYTFADASQRILMPIFVLIAAGMCLSAIGMAVGQFVYMIVQRLRGRPGINWYHHPDEEEEESWIEEEPLPMYVEKEDLPEYTPASEKN